MSFQLHDVHATTDEQYCEDPIDPGKSDDGVKNVAYFSRALAPGKVGPLVLLKCEPDIRSGQSGHVEVMARRSDT